MTWWREDVFFFFFSSSSYKPTPSLATIPCYQLLPQKNVRPENCRRVHRFWVNLASDPRSCSALQLARCPGFRWSKVLTEAVVVVWPQSLLVVVAVLYWLCFVFLALRSPWRINPTSEQGHVCDVTHLSHCIQYLLLLLLQILQNYMIEHKFIIKIYANTSTGKCFPGICTIGPIQPLKALRSSGTLLPRPARYLRTSRVNGRGFGSNPSLWNLNRISSTGPAAPNDGPPLLRV